MYYANCNIQSATQNKKEHLNKGDDQNKNGIIYIYIYDQIKFNRIALLKQLEAFTM